MKINLTSKAKEFLQKSGKNELYIEAVEIQQCCIPLSAPPSVHKGRPLKPEKFQQFESDGFSVFYDRNLMEKPEIVIGIQGFGFLKTLAVTNWEIRY